jgi:ankyrin repeat protein
MRPATILLLVAFLGTALVARAQGPALDPELEAGIRQVDEGNFEAGIAKLDVVARRLKASGDKPLQLSRAYLYLGIAHLQLSQEQAARARFADAAKADKNLKLSEYEFPPPVIKVFEEAKKGAQAEAAASAAAATTPATTPAKPGTATPAKPTAVTRPAVPRPAFFEAVKTGDFPTTRQMLSDDPELATARDQDFGATALHWAALRGQAAIAGLLIASGADPAARNSAGETAEEVARRSKHPEIAAILAPRPGSGAGTGAATSAAAVSSGGVSIFEAAKTGSVERIREILAASPNLVSVHDTAFGATPLHWAALRGQAEAARLLLDKGADVAAVNNDGETPLDVARRAKRANVEQLLSGTSGAPKLRFFQAVREGDTQAVGELLDGDDTLLKERDAAFGATALHWAALRGHAEVVRLLLARGADPGARNNAGETAREVALRAKRDDIVALLPR